MKVEFLYSKNEEDDRKGYAVIIDEKVEMEFIDGEAEDNNIDRNFKDINKIPELFGRIAKSPSPLEIVYTDVDWNTFFERIYE